MKSFIILAGLAGLFLFANSDSESASSADAIPDESKRQLLMSYVGQNAKSIVDRQAFLMAVPKMTASEVNDVYVSLITYVSRGLRPVRSPQVLMWWGRLSAIATKYGLNEDLLLGN